MRERLLKEYYDGLNAIFPEFDGFGELLKYSDWSPWFFFDEVKSAKHWRLYMATEEKLQQIPRSEETRLRSILDMWLRKNRSEICSHPITPFYNPVGVIIKTIENFPIYNTVHASKCHQRLQLVINIIDSGLKNLQTSNYPMSITMCRVLIEQLRGFKITLVTPNTRSGFSDLRNQAQKCKAKILDLARALPHYIKTTAVKEVGCGEAEWQNWMRIFTGLHLDPDTLFESAIADVKFLKDQLPDLQNLRGWKRAHIVGPQDMLKMFKKLQKESEHQIERNFKAVVKTMPTYKMESKTLDTATAMCYQASDIDKNNIVVVDPNDEISEWELRTLALHEGDPGHAFQMQYMLDSGLDWHQVCWRQMAGFVEGWAHYAEMLGDYKKDENLVGVVYFGLWRAVRVVIDVGIHCKGWTQKEAENFLRENTLLDELRIKKETVRYICMPGQASTYWLGRAVIMACREKFSGDIRDFHEKILGGGVQQLNTLLESFGAQL